ncbi:MAG: IS3 family transposase [Candidatus Marinimicrobia bacterium]|nr:IS3 family transposase [Candidatus Neomarinimicrobiota bacterium]
MRLKELAYTHISYGSPRLHVLLQREGWQVNHKCVERIYQEEGLTLAKRKPKRYRSLAARHVRELPEKLNQSWSMDFVHDQMADGRRFKILTVIDIYSRECVIADAKFRYRSQDVINTLQKAIDERDAPENIWCDNGKEFTSRAMDIFAYIQGITMQFSRPGTPTDNAFIESFNGRLRQDCLNHNWFTGMGEVQKTLEMWKINYNLQHPHSSLAYMSPGDYVRSSREGSEVTKPSEILDLLPQSMQILT